MGQHEPTADAASELRPRIPAIDPRHETGAPFETLNEAADIALIFEPMGGFGGENERFRRTPRNNVGTTEARAV